MGIKKYNFEAWCLANNHKDWLDLWDYELNEKAPDMVSYKSSKQYWFKCARGLHESRHKRLSDAVRYNTIQCSKCNSLYQWCIDNNKEEILERFDTELNTESVYDVFKFSNKKYFFKCPKGIHKSELKTICHIVEQGRVPDCRGCISIGQWMIDNLCEDAINKYWSDLNNKDVFEVSAHSTDTYVYIKCNEDNHPDYRIKPGNFTYGCRCPVCVNKTVIPGINDIATTNKEMVKWFKNKEYATKYSSGSSEKVTFVCDVCGFEKTDVICEVRDRGFACPVCGDGFSYPNKFMYNVLLQAGVVFQSEYKINTKNYRYDFYIPDKNVIIEMHGAQHYYQKGFPGCTLEEIQQNDKNKQQFALSSGVQNYIIIDSRYSEKKFIADNILNSMLPNIIDLSKVDWNECEIIARGTLLKDACDIWNSGNHVLSSIAKMIDVSSSTVARYLKRGTEIGLCDYTPQRRYV